MMNKLAFAVPILALAACAGEPDPAPAPDPALIERLARQAAPEAPGTLEKADRLVAAVARVEPDRVAGAAETLLAR